MSILVRLTRLLSLRPLRLTPPSLVFCFNDPPTTEIYTLSLHELFRSDLGYGTGFTDGAGARIVDAAGNVVDGVGDRKSTRLNSSHLGISYAVLCAKKKNHSAAARYRHTKANA